MPAPFRRLDIPQFAELVRLFDFKRRITSFHVHHTWIPRRSHFKGLQTIEAMDRDHRSNRGFSDIAQHITLDPDGFVWTGRAWNAPPASATGFNGNSKAGPFMMEMVGNFDEHEEPFDGVQAEHAYRIVALILQRFGLGTDAIRFHNEMSSKSCPGSSIQKTEFVSRVGEVLAELPSRPADAERDEFLTEALTSLIEPLATRVAPRAADTDGELAEEEETYDQYVARSASEADADGARGADCPTLTQLMDLVPHVVNLRRGRFAEDDLFVSNRGTVDAIFAGLEKQLSDPNTSKPLNVALLAHGGLVSQAGALCKAHRDLWWWKRNGIYPIFFVWHTSLGTAIRDILVRAQDGRRGVSDLSDRIIETFVRHFGGVAVWDSMKLSAAEAVGPEGGAGYVATKLQALLQNHGNNVRVHAIGHSAGAIFHSYFLNAARVPVESLHLLAPAIRIDDYRSRMDPLLAPSNGQVRTAKIYTMRDRAERDDNCVTVYRKSLLYLISRGLELDRDEPILGMDRFLTKDSVVSERFGISPGAGTVGEVFFSPGPRSNATAHGCFDDDVLTMNSIAEFIRGSVPTTSYANAGSGKCAKNSAFEDEPRLPAELAGVFVPPPATVSPSLLVRGRAGAFAPAVAPGRRRALCVGINSYPTAPLHGCVADAELWARTLASLGFEPPTMLLDSLATRAGIIDTLAQMIAGSSRGDAIVFQFSGHGTEVRDLNGDDESDKDQALCPYDFADGHLLIDDDVAALFTRIPTGVSVT
ncbi:MAG TPA: caspase family protein, partial [Thermoanaerobaculia bacterium]|nr:caspase family protein [Thermoanaerobaculia bacterium]